MKRQVKKKSLILIIILSIAGLISSRNLQILNPAYSKNSKPQKIDADTVEEILQPSNSESLELSLEDVSDLALENSLDIQIAKFDAYISRTSLKKEESIFDTIFSAHLSYSDDKKMPASTILGSETKEYEYYLGLEKKLPTGTTISLDASNVKKRTDSSFSTLNPYNEALTGISLTQELGKNFFGLADRSQIKITKIDIENSEFTSLEDIETVLADVQKAYWKLILKKEELLIKEDMLKEAKKLYEIYKDKLSLGLIEESELLTMEALIYARQSDVLIANLEKEAVKNNLLFLINKGDFKQQIIPKDNLVSSVLSVDLYQALKDATENRRDYKRVKNKLKKNKIEIVVKQNALWPEIDLEASFTRNNLNDSLSKAWSGLGSNSNDEISFQLSFKLPLENRQARAKLEAERLSKQQLLLEFKKTERLILQELNDKVSEVNTLQNQVKLYESTVKIHSKKLKAQIRRLNWGRSDADTLIRYEEDLLKARLALVFNLFKYKAGLIELELAQNTLLDKYWNEPLKSY